MGQLVFQATLGGQVNLVGPNTASTFNLNVPAVAGTLVTTGDTGTVTNTMLASSAYTAPGTIGSGTANSGAFTTLSASSTVSGTGFSTYLASPPAIGGTTAAAGTFTTLSGTTSVTTPIVKSASSLTLQSNGTTTAVTIDTSQNVGIGTSSPAQRLEISKGASGGGSLDIAQFTAQDTTGTGATNARVIWSGKNTGGTFNIAALQGINTVSNGGDLAFQTTPSSGSLTERMRIDSSGNLLVGATSQIGTERLSVVATGASSPAAIFKNATSTGDYTVVSWNAGTTGNNQFLAFYTEASPTLRGSITYNRGGGLTSYNVTSDYRAKTINGPVQNALTKLSAIKPSTGRMNGAEYDIDFFIAHELQEVVPSAVTGEKDAVNEDGLPKYQMVDKSALIPLLTAAIQELKSIVDAQASRIATLEAK